MMTAPSSPALVVDKLRVEAKQHFFSPKRVLLDNVSFTLPERTICAFLGANGAGKTTCLRAILGLLRPQAGRIELFGRQVSRPDSRGGLGYVPERPVVPPRLSALEYVTLSARLGGIPAHAAGREALRALEEVGLAAAATQRLKEFSKGMLQRASLAQVLALKPKLLVLDEPLSGLDPQGRLEVRNLIAKQRELGRTVLFSTHVLADIALLCDQVLILKRGVLRHNDTPQALEALVRSNESVFDIALDSPSPEAMATLTALVAEVRKQPGSVIFTARSEAQAMRCVDAARRLNLTIRSLHPVGGGLEHLFAA